ncbi:MAG: hypothetical protein R8G60_06395 [Roseovarius pacificus]|nr:hypothetical protein [Roseovarius pacificus]
MSQPPLGGKAERLFSVQNIPDDIGSQEGKAHQLLDATLRNAVSCRNVGKSVACLDPLEPDKGFVLISAEK